MRLSIRLFTIRRCEHESHTRDLVPYRVMTTTAFVGGSGTLVRGTYVRAIGSCANDLAFGRVVVVVSEAE